LARARPFKARLALASAAIFYWSGAKAPNWKRPCHDIAESRHGATCESSPTSLSKFRFESPRSNTILLAGSVGPFNLHEFRRGTRNLPSGEAGNRLPNHLTRLIHYDWLHSVKSLDLRSPEPQFGEHRFSKRGSMRAQVILCTVGFSLALGATEARATQAASAGAIVQPASNSGDASRDLGALPPPPDSDNPTPASTSPASSAEPIPELPTWVMMLVLFLGLGLAGFKKGRKDRLSAGMD
jgi:hypothetical protein